jgi:D-aminoacyl-tRNA deacylase
MNRILLACTEDPASLNIRDRLLEMAGWEVVSSFDGSPVHRHGDTLIFTKRGLHLDFDLVDREISSHMRSEMAWNVPASDHPLDLLVFLSKHRSEMKVDSLTVHSPGNLGEALFGGRPGTLPPSAPRYISQALRELYKAKKDAGSTDRASFETTHHGPFLSSPSFFIEIGSEERRWGDHALAEVIARSLLAWDMSSFDDERPICIGYGGGHYAPRFTDLAIQGKVDMGHMVPDYAVTSSRDPFGALSLAAGATPGAEGVVFHRTKSNEASLESVVTAAREIGLRFL